MKLLNDFDLLEFVMEKVFPIFLLEVVVILTVALCALLYKTICL